MGTRLLSFLKGRANSVRAGGGAAGAHCDLGCGAIGLAIMIDAVLHVTTDTLDVILCAIGSASALFISTIHFFATSFV